MTKIHGGAFTSDGRQNEELNIQIGKAIAIMRTLFSSCETRIVEKKESSQFSKQSLSLLTHSSSVRS